MFIVVTGGGGFLGSHIARRHLDNDDNVLVVDNWCSSEPNSAHVQLLRDHPNCKVITCDIASKAQLRDAIMDSYFDFRSDVDVFYNFACPASPPRYQAIPIETMMACVVGTKNVLDFALDHDAVVVHASTSEVYGDPDVSPQPEKYRGLVNSFGPRACYDEGKRAAEALCYDYVHKFDLDVRIVRIFNTYGPHMDPDDGRVISNFINQAIARKPLTIYGDGNQTRSFCYVNDLVDGIVKLSGISNPNRIWSRPINLGNPHEFTIRALASAIKLRFPNVSIVNMPLPADDPTQRRPDITLAKSLLTWEPQVQLDEGLDRTIEYFKSLSSTL